MAALQIKNLPTGAGDDIKIDASWALGDTKNVIATAGTSPSFAMFSGSGNGAYQGIGFGRYLLHNEPPEPPAMPCRWFFVFQE